MNLKTWFKKKPSWLRGGIYGVLVCLTLFIFYLIIYLPTLNTIYSDDGLPSYSLALPTLTGHSFVFFSHFIVEGSFLTQNFCLATEEQCKLWTAEKLSNCVSWELEPGEIGCCTDLELVPTESCRSTVEIIVASFLAILLFTLYFLVGVLIIRLKEKRKESNR